MVLNCVSMLVIPRITPPKTPVNCINVSDLPWSLSWWEIWICILYLVTCFVLCCYLCCCWSLRDQTSQSDSAFEDYSRDSNDSPDTQSEMSPTRNTSKNAKNHRNIPTIRRPAPEDKADRSLSNFCTQH